MTGPARPDPTTATHPDETQTPEPDSAEPETSEPDAGAPESAEAEAGEPETPEAEASEPAAPEPTASEPATPEPTVEEPAVAPDEAKAAEPAGELPAEPPEGAQPSVGEERASEGEQPAEPGEAAQAKPDDTKPAEAEAEPADAATAEAVSGEGQPAAAAEVKDAGPGAGQPADAAGAKPAEGEGKKRKKKPKPKPEGPSVGEVVARVGATTDVALAYVGKPDPRLSRLPRKVREPLIADLPAVTAAALLGPAALARHLVASAATGRYRDLFALWDLFRAFPQECKPVLAERQQALARGQRKLHAAVRIGLRGRAERVADDIRRAEGLIWQWLREMLVEALPAVGARPAIAAALLEREPDLDVPIPAQPDARWLAEAAAARGENPLPGPLEAMLAQNAHRLPATVETLRLATRHYPDRVPALLDRVDLDAPDVGAFLAWARDHDAADRLYARIRDRVSAAAARDRAKGLELWYRWTQRGVDVPLPGALQTDSLEDLDLTRPETAAFAARLLERGVELDLQAELEAMAARNRQLAEKAYEAMVCAGLDVTLPDALVGNPIVKDGTRCPKCQAWTWVRPGHEERCPRPAPPPTEPEPDPFELAAAEAARAERS